MTRSRFLSSVFERNTNLFLFELLRSSGPAALCGNVALGDVLASINGKKIDAGSSDKVRQVLPTRGFIRSCLTRSLWASQVLSVVSVHMPKFSNLAVHWLFQGMCMTS